MLVDWRHSKENSRDPSAFRIETVQIHVDMDIQNDVHKDGLFSRTRNACMVLHSVAAGISLHCLNDNTEKKVSDLVFCLFVFFEGGQKIDAALMSALFMFRI